MDYMKLFYIIVVGISLSCIAIFIYIFNPEESGLYPGCPFHSMTRMHCPGCGTLRALHSLFHGDFERACGFNILMVISIPLITGLLVYKILFKKDYIGTVISRSMLFIIVVYWILRNFTIYPFTLLAPH